MTKAEAIAELVRIWHSPHLDLSLKAGLAEAIDALKESNLNDSLVRDDTENCKENESKLDLVRRQAVLDALGESGYCYHFWLDIENIINSLPSEELRKITQESTQDLISRSDAIKTVIRMCSPICDWELEKKAYTDCVIDEINSLPSAEPKTGEWIPVKWHEITDEEREREGYPKDWVVYIDCEMPSDEQEILVQTKSGYVRWDVCYEEGEFSLDSGWDWIEDIVAWMPLPEHYKGGDSE